jgi:hypothetical protein
MFVSSAVHQCRNDGHVLGTPERTAGLAMDAGASSPLLQRQQNRIARFHAFGNAAGQEGIHDLHGSS